MVSARSLGSRSFTGIVNSGWTCVDIVDGDWEHDIGRNCVGIFNEFWWAAFAVGVDERRSAIAVEAGDEFCRFGASTSSTITKGIVEDHVSRVVLPPAEEAGRAETRRESEAVPDYVSVTPTTVSQNSTPPKESLRWRRKRQLELTECVEMGDMDSQTDDSTKCEVGVQTDITLPQRITAMWSCHCIESDTVVDQGVAEKRRRISRRRRC